MSYPASEERRAQRELVVFPGKEIPALRELHIIAGSKEQEALVRKEQGNGAAAWTQAHFLGPESGSRKA